MAERSLAAKDKPDHRTLPRRRGEALNNAIFEAVLAEVAEGGYGRLTMEAVALRAQASKASLYRRWPDRAQLVMDAVYQALPGSDDVPDTGSLRLDALAMLRGIAGQLAGPAGQALRGLLGDALQDSSRAEVIRAYGRGNSAAVMRTILARAVERGECDPASITDRRVEAGPALLRQYFIFTGVPVPDEYLVQIVDDVILPLFHAG